MYTIHKLPNGLYKLRNETNMFTSGAMPWDYIGEMLLIFGIASQAEVDLAKAEMDRTGHDVAEFGTMGHFVITRQRAS